MKSIKKVLRKYLCYTLTATMVFSMFGGVTVAAAKKPKLNQKSLSLSVGQSKSVKVKNGNKKAKVTWKTSKKSVAKITKKKAKGKPYATVKGVKKGKATITAVYKLGKSKKKLKCKVTVTAATPGKTDNAVTTPTPTTVATATPSDNATATPTATATLTPTPTLKPTSTPAPPTPTPFPNLVDVSKLEQQRTLPDVMTFMDGTPVTADNWDARAEEIRQMYQYYMYGIWRDGQGENLSYSVSGKSLKMDISVDGSVQGQVAGASASFSVQVNVPSGTAPEEGWPVIVSMGNLSEQQYALENGYAVINYDTGQVSADSSSHSGAFYKLYPYNSKNWCEQTGVLMAWAWGASKVLDALYAGAGREYGINPDYAIVGGVSRWGKATAVAGAFDTRFKIALPTCSGCGGMGVFRYNPNAEVTQTYDVSSLGFQSTFTYKRGDVETLGSLQSSGEKYWFNEIFSKFKNIYYMPFDQHFLSTLYAQEGRTVMLIGGFNWDTWQNTPNLWYNFLKAKKVFDMLGLSDNIIINLHDTEMGHNIVRDDVVNLFKYCDEMYNGKDVEGFEIGDLQTTLFDLTKTPSGINNKGVFEDQIPE